ncbi:MAG: molybdopterin biosynthesis protein [Methylobacteriaceae bacterium]|nr:molybdopterin biosynthesis protein [Methylobacteriaceae bacterium]
MDRPRPDSFAPAAAAQRQFLRVQSREEALGRLEDALRPGPLGRERVRLAGALGRVLAAPARSAADVPPFDRALVDGFAVRSADLAGAGEARPLTLKLNPEQLACGVVPALVVGPGSATPIATGAPLPRGADAVVMVETTDPVPGGIEVRRPVQAGGHVAFAGSDMTAGETLVRPGTVIGSREIAMLAAAGLGEVEVLRRPKVGVISTGNELVPAGEPLRPAAIHDANGPVIAAAVAEEGCDPVFYGIVPDDPELLRAALRRAHAECDAVILSGGTSKGAGDLAPDLVAELGSPGIVAHGVALKPGKPLVLAVAGGKLVTVLPGFPTSAMFTFHAMVAPTLRRLAGLPARAVSTVPATLPVRIASELGRTEFVMVSLVPGETGLAAYPTARGSGSVTSFAQADGFVAVEALADSVAAGSPVEVTLFSAHTTPPDLVVTGSHCVGLDAVVTRLAERGLATRLIAVGSQGGLVAAARGECDLAPIHLLDPGTGTYNAPYLTAGLELVPGWRRLQGLLFRPGDPRFEGRSVAEAVMAALADRECRLVNRNTGAGTRILLDELLRGARPEGYANQPRSHNAVAAAIAQGRADWGMAIAPVARAAGLGFLPVGPEHYDFALVARRRDRPAVQAFLAALDDPTVLAELAALGFERAGIP